MYKRVVLHILFWVSYCLFKAYININNVSTYYPDTGEWEVFGISMMVQTILLLIKIPLAYILFYIIQQSLSKKWNLLLSVISTLICFAIAVYIFVFVNDNIINKYILISLQPQLPTRLSVRSIVSVLFILGFSSGVAVTAKLIRTSIKQKEIENSITKQKLEAELSFLKSQTNPHFLFNTLNNIYALARKKSDDTADAIMQLSKLLRFMLYESKKDKISIAEEVQILEDYIKLEKLRYGDNLNLSMSKNIDDDKNPITPLILLPFVENAFKHGASENRFGTTIDIQISVLNNKLEFTIVNSKQENEIPIEYSPGLGLSNVKRQLELLYPDHNLVIKNETNTFSVLLNITLKKNA